MYASRFGSRCMQADLVFIAKILKYKGMSKKTRITKKSNK